MNVNKIQGFVGFLVSTINGYKKHGISFPVTDLIIKTVSDLVSELKEVIRNNVFSKEELEALTDKIKMVVDSLRNIATENDLDFFVDKDGQKAMLLLKEIAGGTGNHKAEEGILNIFAYTLVEIGVEIAFGIFMEDFEKKAKNN